MSYNQLLKNNNRVACVFNDAEWHTALVKYVLLSSGGQPTGRGGGIAAKKKLMQV